MAFEYFTQDGRDLRMWIYELRKETKTCMRIENVISKTENEDEVDEALSQGYLRHVDSKLIPIMQNIIELRSKMSKE